MEPTPPQPAKEASPKDLQDLVKAKDARIRELEGKLAAVEREKDEIIDNFQTSTEVLLERIKELEAASFGARPQTANVLERIGTHSTRFTHTTRTGRNRSSEAEPSLRGRYPQC